MPRGRREGDLVGAFFRGLRAAVLEAWTSREGFAYDRVIYAVSYPYRAEDPARVLKWAGLLAELRALPPLARLNETLVSSRYPELASEPPSGASAEGWSAILHFLDPSYPLATVRAASALRTLGFDLPEELSPGSYPAYVTALDELKDKAPVWAVPETNWYLARVLEVGLEAFTPARAARGRPAAAASS